MMKVDHSGRKIKGARSLGNLKLIKIRMTKVDFFSNSSAWNYFQVLHYTFQTAWTAIFKLEHLFLLWGMADTAKSDTHRKIHCQLLFLSTCNQVGNSYLYNELMKFQTDLSPAEFGYNESKRTLRAAWGRGQNWVLCWAVYTFAYSAFQQIHTAIQHKPINISGAQSSEMGKNLSKIRRVRHGGTRLNPQQPASKTW